MQPYFFPYIGYFQLMHAVDLFVFHDDVQYTKEGWINRNRIPVGGKPAWLTMPVRKDSHSLTIDKRAYLLEQGVTRIKRKLQAAYPGTKASPERQLIYDLLDFPEATVARFNANLLRRLADALGLRCDFMDASTLAIGPDVHGEDRVIRICQALGARHYVNPIGGTALYDPEHFAGAGIELSFLSTTIDPTRTSEGPVHFSIIDHLIRTGLPATRSLLPEFTLQPTCAAAP